MIFTASARPAPGARAPPPAQTRSCGRVSQRRRQPREARLSPSPGSPAGTPARRATAAASCWPGNNNKQKKS